MSYYYSSEQKRETLMNQSHERVNIHTRGLQKAHKKDLTLRSANATLMHWQNEMAYVYKRCTAFCQKQMCAWPIHSSVGFGCTV